MGAVILLGASIYGMTLYIVHKLCLDKRYSYDECLVWLRRDQLYDYDPAALAWPQEEVWLRSHDGLQLHGVYLQPFAESQRVAIIVHGYQMAWPWSLQYIDMFLAEGCNLLLVDQRGHGRSQGKYATFGFYEKYDLDRWVNWVRARVGPDAYIVLHGHSMGAGTVLQYAAINKHAQLIVADSGYSDMEELLRHFLRTYFYHLPAWPFLPLIDWQLRRQAGFSLSDVKPIDAIRQAEIPILFAHGGRDRAVPVQMALDMYHAKSEPKSLLIAESAGHSSVHKHDPARYAEKVHELLPQPTRAQSADD